MEKYTLKSIRSVTCGRVNDTENVQLVFSQSSDQSRSCSIQKCALHISVGDSHNNPCITKGGKEVPSLLFTGKLLTKQSWRTTFLPGIHAGVPCRK